jgi:hypothetical protein
MVMRQNYQGLPAAASVEQAIILAQLLILKDLERRRALEAQTQQLLGELAKKLAA